MVKIEIPAASAVVLWDGRVQGNLDDFNGARGFESEGAALS
jgi:hypothetical protein